ncbi:MAG: DUF4738 domain-containing protein [Prevotella sp.]|nr:DUF4738 domain-containing protein [Prevotella sp.]
MKKLLVAVGVMAVLAACNNNHGNNTLANQDKEAKEMMQGYWRNDDAGNFAMLVKGDSIIFPDTSSMPLLFWIYQDSLYTQGSHLQSYKIKKQAAHLFKFVNQLGEEVKLVKTDNTLARKIFAQEHPYAMNIFRTSDIDTTFNYGNQHYTCKIHVETTSDRVIKSTLTDDGIEVDNMYLDNVAQLKVWKNGQNLYAHDFRKKEFEQIVPKELMSASILRGIDFAYADSSGVFFDATIGIPDAATAYIVELRIANNGKLTKKLK